jgi:hypothetical protein
MILKLLLYIKTVVKLRITRIFSGIAKKSGIRTILIQFLKLSSNDIEGNQVT